MRRLQLLVRLGSEKLLADLDSTGQRLATFAATFKPVDPSPRKRGPQTRLQHRFVMLVVLFLEEYTNRRTTRSIKSPTNMNHIHWIKLVCQITDVKIGPGMIDEALKSALRIAKNRRGKINN
jgi:hypothetical protein